MSSGGFNAITLNFDFRSNTSISLDSWQLLNAITFTRYADRKSKPVNDKSIEKSNVRHDEPQCDAGTKISHWFQIKRIYVSERKVGEIFFRILPSSVSALVLRLQISHLQWTIETPNKLVTWYASEVEFGAFRPSTYSINVIILRTEASVFWNVLYGVIKMSNILFFCIACQRNFVQLFSQQSQIIQLKRCQIFLSLDSHEMPVQSSTKHFHCCGFERSICANKV